MLRDAAFQVCTKCLLKLFQRIEFSLSKSFYKAFDTHKDAAVSFLHPSSKFCTLLGAKIECTRVKMTPGGAEKGKFKNKEQIHIPSNI